MAGGKGKEKTPKKTVYELVGERRSHFRRGVEPLDDILLDEERELSREVKRIRLEQIVLKKRREIERMRQQGGEMDMGSLPSNADFLNMAKLMADLSPEEAQRVRSSYTFLKMAEKGGGGGMAFMPMLLNYAKQNPGASEDQMIKYLTLMDSQLMKGLEISKAMNPPRAGDPVDYMVKGMELMKTANPQKQDNPMEFLKLMKDLVIEGVRNPLMTAIKESQPQPGVFEQILTNPQLFTRFKEIGIFGGGAGATKGSFDLEIEKLRGERALTIKKLELDNQRMLLEAQAKDRQSDNMIALLSPLTALFATPIANRMQQLGAQQAAAHMPPSVITSEAPPTGTTILLRCTCGYEGPITFPGPPPNLIPCPSCGQELLVGGTPPGENK